jgi:hypothetical protein
MIAAPTLPRRSALAWPSTRCTALTFAAALTVFGGSPGEGHPTRCLVSIATGWIHPTILSRSGLFVHCRLRGRVQARRQFRHRDPSSGETPGAVARG